MGEAKRRRLLDPNYGRAKMPDCLKAIKSEFFNKQTDLEIMSVYDCRNYPDGLTKNYLILPSPSDQNDARHLFVKYQQQVMSSIIPLIEEHGKGWIAQMHDYQKNYTQWGYVPATRLNLTHIQTKVLSGSLGKIVGDVIQYALESWSFESSSQLIPVIAMTNSNEDSSYLYCI